MSMRPQEVPRATVRREPCPWCRAAAGAPCVGARGKTRESHHIDRVMTAIDHRNPSPPDPGANP